MKIYLAGKVTGNGNYKEQFGLAEDYLLMQGHQVINPIENEGFSYRDYIDMGLTKLSKCECICLLDGWRESNGALLEYQYAITVGMTIWLFDERVLYGNKR